MDNQLEILFKENNNDISEHSNENLKKNDQKFIIHELTI